jgi:hypothetical protein
MKAAPKPKLRPAADRRAASARRMHVPTGTTIARRADRLAALADRAEALGLALEAEAALIAS